MGSLCLSVFFRSKKSEKGKVYDNGSLIAVEYKKGRDKPSTPPPLKFYCIPKSICWRFTSSSVRCRSSSVICVEMEDMLVSVVRCTLSDGQSV